MARSRHRQGPGVFRDPACLESGRPSRKAAGFVRAECCDEICETPPPAGPEEGGRGRCTEQAWCHGAADASTERIAFA